MLKAVNAVRFERWIAYSQKRKRLRFCRGNVALNVERFGVNILFFTDGKRTALSAFVMALAILSFKCESDFAFNQKRED
ncbi:hypothetical protein [Salmonella enterica]|uniref:hypothetical protein n=1 Tax=Salmonella enterica TaxID=28901 RepID=UPI0015E80DD6|nr:hypothetical protein [Salmonella enterica]